MAGPPWADTLFAGLSVLMALYWAGRLMRGRRAGTPGALTHLVMAAGMAAMFAPSVDPFPRALWIGLYAVNGAWLIAALPRATAGAGGVFGAGQRHHLHLVMSTVAMVYMFAMMGTPAPSQATAVALPASGVVLAHDHGGGGGVSLTPVTAAFALYFLAHAVWSGRPVVRPQFRASTEGPAVTVPLSGSRLAAAGHVVMGLGMSYMFAMMLG